MDTRFLTNQKSVIEDVLGIVLNYVITFIKYRRMNGNKHGHDIHLFVVRTILKACAQIMVMAVV